MFPTLKRENDVTSTTITVSSVEERSSNSFPIARTDGGSVSAIRNFVFGEKIQENKKFNSLSHHWKKKTIDPESQIKLKSPSFRGYKRSFFQNWSKSFSRYASTPDLNNETVERNPTERVEFSDRPSVKKMVREFEKTASLKSRFPVGKNSKRSKSVPRFEQHEEVSLKPDSISSRLSSSPSLSHRQSTSLQKTASLKEVQSRFGVSNPIYGEVTSLENNKCPSKNGRSLRVNSFTSPKLVNGYQENENSKSSFENTSFKNVSELITNPFEKSIEDHFSAIGNFDERTESIMNIEIAEPFIPNQSFSEVKINENVKETVIVKGKNEPLKNNSGSDVDKTIVVQEPGRFLARWIPLEDLSSRDYESSVEASGGTDAETDVSINVSINSDASLASDFSMDSKLAKRKHPTERRESGRFHSAARILRSLTRNRNSEDLKKESLNNEGSSIARSNPFYHSEGKGSKKKLERESVASSSKERSRSFCDKPEAKKKFLRKQENHLLRQEARAKLDQVESSQQRPVNNTSCHARNFSLPSVSEASNLNGDSLIDSQLYLKTPSTIESDLHAFSDVVQSKNFSEVEETTEIEGNALERDKERRSARKLTKDSGYETSPHSEGDYTNIELLQAEGEASTEGNVDAQLVEVKTEENFKIIERSSQIEDIKCSSPVSASSGSLRVDPSDSVCLTTRLKNPERIDKLPNISPVDSLSNFADSLVTNLPTSSPSVTLVPAVSSPSLYQYANCAVLSQDEPEEETDNVNGTLIASKSTPNLEEIADDDDTMVTNKLSSYYLQGSSSGKMGSNQNRTDKKYWSQLSASEDSFNQTDYAHHLRSSSYQILHSRQLSSGPCHSRQLSNTSNYSEGDEGGCREDAVFNNSYHQSSHNVADRSRCFSFDNLGYDGGSHSLSWNISEPDLSLAPPVSTSLCSLSPKYDQSQISPSNTSVPLLSKRSSNSCKLSPSPPPPPVRDASSLKYIRYGPGHEKFPSWPVPAGSSLVIPQASQIHDSSISSVADHPSCNYLSPQGSQRSHSWTEQSEYPKERCGGYVRPSHKKQFSPSFQKQLLTVMEKCEKISPEVFKSRHPDDILKAPCYSFIDNYLHQTSCYPPFDREGRAIDDKDYSIPSPPERDPGMGESHISEMTSAQLEEHTRRCDVVYSDIPYADFPQITPLLDQLRQESYTWDGSSERDSGRGESESITDSRYSSNGRESVTTVVTNSSSASSSETLKWHGSLSDVSVLSSQSRETKGDHNIVHSARVQAPQRQNSESVQYYSVNGRGKHFNKFYDARIGREGNYPKPYREGKWSREVERNNEVNNLKKFPSYSYTQPLSQINEAPLAESRESLSSSPRSPKGSSVDFNKPPSVAERISELERQSNFNTNTMSAFNWPRTSNDFRDPVHFRDEQYHSLGAGLDITQESDPKKTSDREPKADSLPARPDVNLEYSQNQFQSPSSPVSLSFHHSRIPKRRDSEDSVLSSDSFGESEKTSFSTSYTYLDPEKRCKVSDATLKNIQKQALLSFYERRTGKCYNGASPSSSSSSSSVASPISGSDSIHPEWTGRSLRKEKGAKSCTGLAKLGRVPTSDKVGGDRNTEGERYCSKAIRRRSVNGRDVREGNPTESSALSDLYLPRPIKTNSQAILVNSCENEGDQEFKDGMDRKSSVSRAYPDVSANSPSTANSKMEGIVSPSDTDLPPLPPSLEDTPPKPPDRPPKKANLRSLFHPPPEDNLIKEVPSPSRPYFYRKPPAPDPPLTPPESPPPSSTSSNTSRSSTPDLPPPPPPPPPPITEEVLIDEPLPPPPPTPPHPETLQHDAISMTSSCSTSEAEDLSSTPVQNSLRSPYKEAYHKDSYMAHRKDWKTGYEGRYRRTHSPTGSDRTGTTVIDRPDVPSTTQNRNHLIKNSPTKTLTQPFHSSGNLRSAISTSSLLHRPPSPLDNVSFFTDKTNINNNNNYNSYNNNNNTINNNHKKSKGWSPHVRQKSTTVNFTAEELRAFKARRAAQENMLSSTGELRSEMSSQDSSPSSSPLRPLTRAFSMGEPFHFINGEEKISTETGYSESKLDSTLTSVSVDISSGHDGPITAHPAQVTEETPTEPEKCLPADTLSASMISLEESTLPASLTSMTFAQRQSPTVLSDVSSSVTSSTSSLASTLSSSSSTLVSSSSSSSSTSCITMSSSAPKSYFNRLDYKKVLSSIGTCPSMSLPHLSPEETADRANIIVLTYGRTPKAEILNCDKLSMEFVQMGKWDSKLKALLAPAPPYKCMGSYMDGIFALEIRKDLLCASHAQHPDVHSVNLSNGLTQLFSSEIEQNLRNDGKASHTTNFSGFSSGESKGTSLSSLPVAEVPQRESSKNTSADSNLNSKKEELINSISRKLVVLKGEQRTIEGEMSQNVDVGTRVTEWVVEKAKPSEADKVKLHMEEIDKITSLLLSLCGRLARVENSLLLTKDEENNEYKRGLEGKREKLTDQLEEAKKLKEDIDRRAVQVCKILMKYLTEEEYAEYDHFVKMKAKLIMDMKETEDKIKIGEEQMMALQNLILSP